MLRDTNPYIPPYGSSKCTVDIDSIALYVVVLRFNSLRTRNIDLCPKAALVGIPPRVDFIPIDILSIQMWKPYSVICQQLVAVSSREAWSIEVVTNM